MEFGQLVSNENQQARFKKFSTLKMMVLHERSNIAVFLVKYQQFSDRKIYSFGM